MNSSAMTVPMPRRGLLPAKDKSSPVIVVRKTDDTDNHKKVENGANKTALCSIRYT